MCFTTIQSTGTIILLNWSGICAIPSTSNDAPVTPVTATVVGHISTLRGTSDLQHIVRAAPVSTKQLTNTGPTVTET